MSTTDSTEALLKQLEEIKNKTNLSFEKRLMDTAIWFHRNKHLVPRENLPKRLDFMEKTMDCVLEMFAMSLQRTQEMEGHARSSVLYTPRGLTMKF